MINIEFIRKHFIIMNMIWFQCMWLLAVIFQNKGLVFLAGLLCLHFYLSPKRDADIAILPIIAFGLICDSLLTILGFYEFSEIPIWLIALWLGFILTINHSMSWIFKLPLVVRIVLFSMMSALSYFAAYNLNAVNFPRSLTMTMSLIGLYWGVLSVLLSKFMSRHNWLKI